ncbi:TIGR04149 family rSAM-modified RiPP [Bacteroides thetaiotaomicron]|uniref:TIGR04149 family rSAM-modified RiPP n=1 Tax=Bacteroides thetaiotaomicron TaxID=818 RepID=UPI001F3BA794|nr:TIGR04149 family rSAM-modified RiPP [Bacteroides thetaiotaomicron]MCE9019586.1 TIGR04149 family rSAM-modified RiPP [Bacteroides thetaiotaomicron]
MKKLKNLSLHRLNQSEISKKEMNALTGGASCLCHCHCVCNANCPCRYAGEQEGPNDSYYGGSSTSDNFNANSGNLVNNTANNTKTITGKSDAKSYPLY